MNAIFETTEPLWYRHEIASIVIQHRRVLVRGSPRGGVICTPGCSLSAAGIGRLASVDSLPQENGPISSSSSFCLSDLALLHSDLTMKTLTVRLPDALAAEIEAESRRRRLPKSDIVRERLSVVALSPRGCRTPVDPIADLIGSVDGLPADLSARRKHYLRRSAYGGKRPRFRWVPGRSPIPSS
jgi:hypothetical protein